MKVSPSRVKDSLGVIPRTQLSCPKEPLDERMNSLYGTLISTPLKSKSIVPARSARLQSTG